MTKIRKFGQLAAVGSTGNATHASVEVPKDADSFAFKFEVTAIGGSPSVTYKLQGSMDELGTTDANSDWFDLLWLPNDSNTEIATVARTTVGVWEGYIQSLRRFVVKIRLVTSANTNVTYESEAHSDWEK